MNLIPLSFLFYFLTTNMSSTPVDVPIPQLTEAIIAQTDIIPTANDRYFYYNFDLNTDGTDEILVYAYGTNFSGSGGGTLLIFDEKGSDYHLFSTTTLVNFPILINQTKTQTYHDIVVTVSGGGIVQPYLSHLMYSNGSYPLNASTQPQITKTQLLPIQIFSPLDYQTNTFPLLID